MSKADLEAMAKSASTDLETYTLARVIASEAGTDTMERVGVAWATVNRVAIWAERGKYDYPITARVTLEQGVGPTWTYGPQNQGPRVVSTRQAPNANHLEVARLVLAELVPDPTNGAQAFINPSAQDKLLAIGTAGYSQGASTVLKRWMAEGWKPTVVIGKTLFLKLGSAPSPFIDINPDPPKDRSSIAAFIVGAGLIGAAVWLWLKG